MRGLALLTALAIGSTLPPSVASAATHVGPERSQVEELFYDGSAKYSAADYVGAIESFTEALKIATKEGTDPPVRSALLQNLARAHVKAYDVDGEIRHLKKAREIYGNFVREAETAKYAEADVSEAESRAAELDDRISELESKQAEAAAQPTASTDPGGNDATDTKAEGRRKRGIAFVAVGSALVAGGIGTLAYGTTFKGHAEDVIDDAKASEGDDWSDSDQEDADDFIERETRTGRIVIGVGAALAVVGVAGVVVGALDLVAAKKAKETASLRFAPMLGRGGAGLVLTGRF